MSRFQWTDDAMAELRRQLNYERTYSEIGMMLGVTENAVRMAVQRFGWSSMGRISFLNHRRNRGKPRSPEVRAKIAAAQKALWQNPEHRERMLATITENNQSPARCQKIRATIARKRGFAVPEEMRADYRWLLDAKNMTAIEAGAALGLTKPSHSIATSKGA